MSLPRREFLLASTASLLTLLDAAPAAAAGATRSRLFVSQWPLRKIAWHFALGVFKQLSQALDLDQVAKDIVAGGAHAKLETLSKQAGAIDVRIDNFQVHLNGVPPRREVQEIARALLKFSKEVLSDPERLSQQEIHELLAEFVADVRPLAQRATVQIFYQLHSEKMNFTLYKKVSFSDGHVRLEASIRQSGATQLP